MLKNRLKTKSSLFTFLALFILATFSSSKGESQYYYNPGYYSDVFYGGGCLTGAYGYKCPTSYKAATGIGLGMDAINYGIQTYQYHKAQEQQIQETHYQAEATRSAVNYQKQMEDYKNMMLVAPFFDDSIPRSKSSNNQNPKVPSLTKRPYETK